MAQRAQWPKKRTAKLSLLVCFLAGFPYCHPHGTTGEGAGPGIVVEEVGERLALEVAGIRPGDIVVAWEPLFGPSTEPQQIRTVFDWRWLEAEQAPLGRIRVTAQRDGQTRLFDAAPGLWQVQVRPRMSKAQGRLYLRGKERLEAENFSQMARLWERLMVGTEQAEWPLRSWVQLRLGQAWTLAGEWEKAHASYVRALEQAQDSPAQVAVWEALGKAYEGREEFKEAQEAYTSAQEIRRQAGGTGLGLVEGWVNLGRVATQQGEFDAAQVFLQQALDRVLEQAPESRLLARSLEALGGLARAQGILDAAAEHYERALELWRRLAPGSLGVARSLHNLGTVAGARRDLDQAEKYYQGALVVAETRAPESLLVVRILVGQATVAGRREDLDKADEYLDRALELTQRKAPGRLDEAAVLFIRGRIAQRRGDLELAEENHLRALEIQQRWTPNSTEVASSFNNLALLVRNRGDLEAAEQYLDRALDIKRRHVPNSLDHANSLNNLGNIKMQRGDLDAAANCFYRALEIRERWIPGSETVARTLGNLGNLFWRRGDLDRADDYYLSALEIRQKVEGGGSRTADSWNERGKLMRARGDLQKAREYHTQALKIHEELKADSLEVADTLNQLGTVTWKLGDSVGAENLFLRALKIQETQAPESLGVSFILNNLGRLAVERGEFERGTEYHEGALGIQQNRAPKTKAEARTLHALGALRRQQGRPREALVRFLQALGALDSQVSRLGGPDDVRAGFRADYGKLYHDPVDLFLELEQPAEAFHVLERYRARSFLERLAERDVVFSIHPLLEKERRRIGATYDRVQRDIERLDPNDSQKREPLVRKLRQLVERKSAIAEEVRRESPRLAALQYPQPLEFARVQEVLDPGTVMLSYFVGENATHLFVVNRNEPLHVETLDMGAGLLGKEVGTFLNQIPEARSGTPDEEYDRKRVQSTARSLYTRLVQPVAPWVEKSDRVLILADGPLRLLPWGALVRENGQFLVEWKPLHFASSATVYGELRKSRRERRESPTGSAASLVAFGDPVFPDPSSQTTIDRIRGLLAEDTRRLWTPLPASRREVERIAELYPQSQIFLGAEATEERVKTLGPDVRLLHLATHGFFDPVMPLNSEVVLSIPEELTEGGDNGRLQVWEVFELRLAADLVVLSACQSALGRNVGGEGLLGLVRAFLYAGAQSVAASLWRVSDEVTAELMPRFYRHLREGKPKAEALRAAQVELIQGRVLLPTKNGGTVQKDLSTPYYWAAFQIYGDWR